MRRVTHMKWIMLAVVALAGCVSGPPQPEPSAAPVIAAERAFAARAGEIGWIPAFREYAAADGMLGQPGYPNAQQTLAETPDDGNRLLFWWPAYAGIARSGEFGFTTGPFSVDEARTPRGHYFTVWRRQPDGSWRWIYDGGVGPFAEPNLIAPNAELVPSVPISTAGVGSSDAAIGAVRAIEEGASPLTLVRRLAGEAQVFRTGQARGVGAEAGGALMFPSRETAYTPTRIEASASGDLVMVLGEARWQGEAGPVQGLYARMWQHRAEGWRIVFDQLVIPRAPPPG